MDFHKEFINALSYPPRLPQGKRADDLLGTLPGEPDLEDTGLLHILAGGSITAPLPYSYDLQPLNCSLLLYTVSGQGKLTLRQESFSLTPESLLLFNCNSHFSLHAAAAPWTFQILFIRGSALPDYYRLLPKDEPILRPLSVHDEGCRNLQRLLLDRSSAPSVHLLHTSSLLAVLLSDCIIYRLKQEEPSPELPSYLSRMQELFDRHFREHYSLDELEKSFGISRYKLCREFGAAFGEPPLKYLNRKRIEAAKHLLVTTDLKVYEIGAETGIENTNHFISQFKKITGVTPAEYRRRFVR